jgi:hypothetical protein
MIQPQYNQVVNNILVKDFLKMGDLHDQSAPDQTKLNKNNDIIKTNISTMKISSPDAINKEMLRDVPDEKNGPRANSVLTQPSFLNGWQ